MANRNTQYDILDKILNESSDGRTNGKRWHCPDPSKPNEGYWIDSQETFEELRRSTDALEKFLRA